MALPNHFWNLHQLLEPQVPHGREVYSSAKSSAASELRASLLLTFLQAPVGIFEAGTEGLEAHTISRMKERNSTLNLYTHTKLCSLAFLIIPNILRFTTSEHWAKCDFSDLIITPRSLQ